MEFMREGGFKMGPVRTQVIEIEYMSDSKNVGLECNSSDQKIIAGSTSRSQNDIMWDSKKDTYFK